MIRSLPARRFTAEEFHRMMDAGILTEDDRVELIRGEIISMTPVGPEHAACVNWLARLFIRRVADDVVVHVQNPLQITEDNELYPDVALLRPCPNRYRDRSPGGQDALLVVEVADTSLERDTSVKAPLYAQSGVAEVWVVDLVKRQLHRFRQPSSGCYGAVTVEAGGTRVSPELIPDLVLTVEEIFS